MGGQKKPEIAYQGHQQSMGYEGMLQTMMNDFLSGKYQQNLPTQFNAPDMSASEGALQQSINSTNRYGADMEKFFYGSMLGGNAQNTDNIMRQMQQLGQRQDQQALAQVKASGIPMGSSAMARAASGALGDSAMQRNLAMSQMQLNQANQNFQNQMAGAAGLSGMPNYYAQPTSIEMAMLGARLPYDMAGIQNQQLNAQLRNQQLGYGASIANQFGANNWYMPDTVMYQPQTWWERNAPFLGDAATAAAILSLSLSDEKYKEDIRPLERTSIIDNLNVYRFKWRDHTPIPYLKGESIGVIAQEVEKVVPEAVVTIDNNRMIKPDVLIGLLIDEVKQLKVEVAALKGVK